MITIYIYIYLVRKQTHLLLVISMNMFHVFRTNTGSTRLSFHYLVAWGRQIATIRRMVNPRSAFFVG